MREQGVGMKGIHSVKEMDQKCHGLQIVVGQNPTCR